MDGHVILAYDYPLLGALGTTMWIFLWILWIFLLSRTIVDALHDDRLSGWAKAAWILVMIVFPFIGVLFYVLVRGKDLGRRHRQRIRADHVELLEQLSRLHAGGDISDDEFRRAKEKILG